MIRNLQFLCSCSLERNETFWASYLGHWAQAQINAQLRSQPIKNFVFDAKVISQFLPQWHQPIFSVTWTLVYFDSSVLRANICPTLTLELKTGSDHVFGSWLVTISSSLAKENDTCPYSSVRMTFVTKNDSANLGRWSHVTSILQEGLLRNDFHFSVSEDWDLQWCKEY